MNTKRKSYRIVLTILFSIAIFLVAKTSLAAECVVGGCDDGDDCTTDWCIASSGECRHAPITGCNDPEPEPDPEPGPNNECASKTNGTLCSIGKCRSGVCTKYITDCHGDDQDYAGLIADYSDGSKSSRIYSTCVSSGGTPNVAYGPPEGVIKTYSCHTGDFDVDSNTSDCGTRDSRLCDGSYVTYYSHCNYSQGTNYWNSTHAYCNWLPGDCNSCTVDGVCAANTCIGDSCLNNCGTYSDGTKDCSSTPTNGECGTKARSYPPTTTAFPATDTTCVDPISNPSPEPVFPTKPGESVSWICAGVGGSLVNDNCTASRMPETLPCISKCTEENEKNTCKGETIVDGCIPNKTCQGIKDCSWREVAP